MSTNFLNKLNCISFLTNLKLHDISNILIINFLRISTAHMVRSVSLCLYSLKMLTLKKTQELGCVNAKWLRNCACSEVKPFI